MRLKHCRYWGKRMSDFPYELTGPLGAQATFGHIVLQVDETLEQDMRQLLPGGSGIAHYVSRVASGAELTPDTIAEMATALTGAASLLPAALRFDVVGYGCTSGTTLIGADRVADMVRAGVDVAHVTDPLTAALAALKALKIGPVALVSPYVDQVSAPVRAAFAGAGHPVLGSVSFGEAVEARVARIAPASTRAAAIAAYEQSGGQAEALFLSCTNLQTLDIITDLEQELDIPVLSSNQVLAWHMAQLAGVAVGAGIGRIFAVT